MKRKRECHFSDKLPRFFERDIKRLERKYPKVRSDLNDLIRQIERDCERTAHARRVPGFGDEEVRKYRCKNSGGTRGSQGGFRLIARIADGIVTPLAVFAKSRSEDMSKESI